MRLGRGTINALLIDQQNKEEEREEGREEGREESCDGREEKHRPQALPLTLGRLSCSLSSRHTSCFVIFTSRVAEAL